MGSCFFIFICKNNSHKGTIGIKSTLARFFFPKKNAYFFLTLLLLLLPSSSSYSFSKTYFIFPFCPSSSCSCVALEKNIRQISFGVERSLAGASFFIFICRNNYSNCTMMIHLNTYMLIQFYFTHLMGLWSCS